MTKRKSKSPGGFAGGYKFGSYFEQNEQNREDLRKRKPYKTPGFWEE